jgi:hypothetical protein
MTRIRTTTMGLSMKIYAQIGWLTLMLATMALPASANNGHGVYPATSGSGTAIVGATEAARGDSARAAGWYGWDDGTASSQLPAGSGGRFLTRPMRDLNTPQPSVWPIMDSRHRIPPWCYKFSDRERRRHDSCRQGWDRR